VADGCGRWAGFRQPLLPWRPARSSPTCAPQPYVLNPAYKVPLVLLRSSLNAISNQRLPYCPDPGSPRRPRLHPPTWLLSGCLIAICQPCSPHDSSTLQPKRCIPCFCSTLTMPPALTAASSRGFACSSADDPAHPVVSASRAPAPNEASSNHGCVKLQPRPDHLITKHMFDNRLHKKYFRCGFKTDTSREIVESDHRT
jgi:hypothetical protein